MGWGGEQRLARPASSLGGGAGSSLSYSVGLARTEKRLQAKGKVLAQSKGTTGARPGALTATCHSRGPWTQARGFLQRWEQEMTLEVFGL